MNQLQDDRSGRPSSSAGNRTRARVESHRRGRWLAVGVSCLVLFVSHTACGQESFGEPVHQRPSDEALGSTPWYDAEEDRVVPVRVEGENDDSENRNSRWLPQAQRLSKTPAASGSANATWSWGNVFAWFLLVAVLLLVVAGLVYAFTRAEADVGVVRRETAGRFPEERTLQRMQQLPAELRHATGNLRDETLRRMAAGEWNAAVVTLFGHQLLLLDEFSLLRLTRGKTNGSYVRETRASDTDAAAILQHTVDAFERGYFGRYPLSQENLTALWQENLKLETLLASRRGAAA